MTEQPSLFAKPSRWGIKYEEDGITYRIPWGFGSVSAQSRPKGHVFTCGHQTTKRDYANVMSDGTELCTSCAKEASRPLWRQVDVVQEQEASVLLTAKSSPDED